MWSNGKSLMTQDTAELNETYNDQYKMDDATIR